MPTKKRTSTKKPQSAVPQQPAISESALRFTTRFLMHAKCLSGEQQHDDPLQLAFEVFVGWPNEFWMRHQEQGVVPPLDDHAFRQLLAQAHEAATRVLMRAAESRGLDSSAISAIWTASRIARDAILTRTNFHLPAGGWSRPWPECLGDDLPERQQRVVDDADAVLVRLGTMLDGKWACEQSDTPEDNKPGDPIEQALIGQSLALYRVLRARRHWVLYDTVADEDCDWKAFPPRDSAIQRALKKLQSALSIIGPRAPSLKLDHAHRRAKLIPPGT